MARKKRDPEVTGYNFAQKDVLRAFGMALINDATIVDVSRRQVQQVLNVGEDYKAFDHREVAQLSRAYDELEAAQRRILVVGRRARTRAAK
jgi:hypothetical protein